MGLWGASEDRGACLGVQTLNDKEAIMIDTTCPWVSKVLRFPCFFFFSCFFFSSRCTGKSSFCSPHACWVASGIRVSFASNNVLAAVEPAYLQKERR